MIKDSQIIDKLKKIDQAHFEMLIDHLIYQGAYPEISPSNSFVETYGVNIEKERTRKSLFRADSEIKTLSTVIEKSVDAKWKKKFKRDALKQINKGVDMFVFATNQDVGNKFIKLKKKSISCEDYCKQNLGCKKSFVIGQTELVLALQKPEFINIRRNFLSLPNDFFCNVDGFQAQINENGLYSCNVNQELLEKCSADIGQAVSFSPDKITILHNDNYGILLHAIGKWAQNCRLKQKFAIENDFCFLNWPRGNSDLNDIDSRELSDNVKNFVIIWNAQTMQNLSDYLKFYKQTTSLIFITPSLHKEVVIKKLNSYGANLSIGEVRIAAIDTCVLSQEEIEEHESKIKQIVKDTTDLLLKVESLIYFNAPLYLNNEFKIDKILKPLGIDKKQFNYLKSLLINNDLASITGNILWLKKPSVAKKLLDKFIKKGIFRIEDLI